MDVEVKFSDFTTEYLSGYDAIPTLVGKATFDVEAEAKTAILTGAKTGRVYKRRRRGKAGKRSGDKAFITHQASAEGEAPANDGGGLAGSVQGKMIDPHTGEVRVGKGYGAVLEPKRPFLKPAVDKVEPGFVAAVKSVVDGKR